MESITVVALDDHYLVREGIRSLLKEHQNIVLVGEGSAGEHLELLVEEHNPDVVLLDLSMPQKEGVPRTPENSFRAIPAIFRLLRQHPHIGVIIISQHLSPALVEDALKAGAQGYLLKDDVLTRFLPDAIRLVHAGALYFSLEVQRQLMNISLELTPGSLTNRQAEIIRSVVAHPNITSAERARRLNISEHTLSNHLRQIFSRLGVGNLTAAVLKAIEKGIVPASFVEPVERLGGGGLDLK